MGATLSVSIDLVMEAQAAFDAMVDEVSLLLENSGFRWTAGPGGQLKQDDSVIGQIRAWEPGKRIVLEWQPGTWSEGSSATIELNLSPADSGTHVSLTCKNWEHGLGDGQEAAGWFFSQVVTPLVLAVSPERLGNWLTDRRARRPSGLLSRGTYRDPLYHYPNFKVILAELKLRPNDELLDVGCGGGALLKEALKSGCRAAGIDHSLDMVHVATQENQRAVSDGRLVVKQAPADHLPFDDGRFTCATMTGVLGFLPDAPAAFREIYRVLRPGGRIVIFGSDPALRGTPAAPEPIASHLHFYDDREFGDLARNAGFSDVRVVRRDLLPFAREVGVPEEHLALFAGNGAPFLLAKKVQ